MSILPDIPDSNEVLLKVTNETETHYDHVYHDGLNILSGKFARYGSCVPGRLYFTNNKNIDKYYVYGIYLRVVYLPRDDPEFECVADDNDKWGANKIILSNRYSLFDPVTYDLFGLDMKKNTKLVDKASEVGDIEFLNMWRNSDLFSIIPYSSRAIDHASKNGHVNILKWWFKSGLSLKYTELAFDWACDFGRESVVKLWIDSGFNILWSRYAKEKASENKHNNILNMIKVLKMNEIKNGKQNYNYLIQPSQIKKCENNLIKYWGEFIVSSFNDNYKDVKCLDTLISIQEIEDNVDKILNNEIMYELYTHNAYRKQHELMRVIYKTKLNELNIQIKQIEKIKNDAYEIEKNIFLKLNNMIEKDCVYHIETNYAYQNKILNLEELMLNDITENNNKIGGHEHSYRYYKDTMLKFQLSELKRQKQYLENLEKLEKLRSKVSYMTPGIYSGTKINDIFVKCPHLFIAPISEKINVVMHIELIQSIEIFGNYVWKLNLPINDPELKIYVPSNENSVIVNKCCGKKYSLFDLSFYAKYKNFISVISNIKKIVYNAYKNNDPDFNEYFEKSGLEYNWMFGKVIIKNAMQRS